jgi:hypothetical protein
MRDGVCAKTHMRSETVFPHPERFHVRSVADLRLPQPEPDSVVVATEPSALWVSAQTAGLSSRRLVFRLEEKYGR